MRGHPIAQRLRKEAARGGAPDGTECCYAPWTCCDPKVLAEAADVLDRQRAYIQKLEKRIHNQRANGRITWEIVEMRRKWLGSDTARRHIIRYLGVIRDLRDKLKEHTA